MPKLLLGSLYAWSTTALSAPSHWTLWLLWRLETWQAHFALVQGLSAIDSPARTHPLRSILMRLSTKTCEGSTTVTVCHQTLMAHCIRSCITQRATASVHLHLDALVCPKARTGWAGWPDTSLQSVKPPWSAGTWKKTQLSPPHAC